MKSPLFKKYSGLLMICGVSCLLISVYVYHTLRNDFLPVRFLLGLLLPIGLASSLLLGSGWLWKQDLDAEAIFRVGVWTVLGSVLFAIGASLIVLYQDAHGIIMTDRVFMVANTVSGGAVGGFILGLYDSRKRQARIEATQLNQKITVLNRVLRHDIRTRGNVISGHAEILKEKLSEDHEEIEEIINQVGEIVKIGNQAKEIENVLQESTKEPETIDIVPLIETSCEALVEDYPTANISSSLPVTQSVIAHPLIESAFHNVIENAIEHNDKPTPEVSISCDPIVKNGTQYVKIQIADNGPGISANEIEVIENGYETNLNHLSGLGLWLVNWIVTNSNGTIKFESNEPEGSIVKFYFESAEN